MILVAPLRARCIPAAVAALALWSVQAAAQTESPSARKGQGPHVRVELIANRAVPAPGLTLGLKFDLDPDWHIYWLNPGDSGGPPEAFWTLPPGVTASEFAWPAPERIDVGGLVNYGYHGTVVLPVSITSAPGAAMPREFTAKATVRWMACANLCVPGQAEIALRFPLSTSEGREVPGWKQSIDASLDRVPGPAPESWTATAASSGDTFVLDVVTGSREDTAVFFPLEVSEVDDSADQKVTPIQNGVRLELRKSSQLVADPNVLTGVLSLSGRRAFVISAPVERRIEASSRKPEARGRYRPH